MTEDGRSARWEAHREEQRRRIVEAAASLIEAGDPSPSLIGVGQQAGLARSIVYRHFADKAALDEAVRTQLVEDLWARLSAEIRLRGSLRDTVEDALRAYVDWAGTHPSLHATGAGPTSQGIVRNALDSLAAQATDLFVEGFAAAGAAVTEADRLTAAPLTYGLVNGIFATVSMWTRQGAKVPSAEQLVAVTTEAVLAMIVTRLAAYGVSIDPDASLADLLAPAPAGSNDRDG